MSRFATGAKPSASLKPLLRHRLSLAALLHLQWVARRFTRYDLALRSLAAQSLLQGSAGDDFLEWYRQMQRQRAGADSLKSFEELVASVSERGLDPDYPVGVTPRGELLDGAHRVGVALAVGAEDIAVDPRRSRRPRPFGREWFRGAGFPPEMLHACDAEIERLMATTGADGFLVTHAQSTERASWLDPHLPSDTEVVSYSEITLDDLGAKELESSARYLPRHQKGSLPDEASLLRAGEWGVWRLRSYRPRFACVPKTATSIARSQHELRVALEGTLGAENVLVTLTHAQQRRVARVLESRGWNHLEGVPWH